MVFSKLKEGYKLISIDLQMRYTEHQCTFKTYRIFWKVFFCFFLEITVDIDRIVLLGDKSLKSFRKFGKRFSHTIFLDRFHELFIADITILFDSFSKIRIMFRVKINPSLFLQVVNSQIFLSCLLFNFVFSIPSCTVVSSGHFWKEKNV